MNGSPSQSKRPKLTDNNETAAITPLDSTVEGITAEDEMAVQCAVVAGLLGSGPFKKALLMDEAWLSKLHGLAASGSTTTEALRRYRTLTPFGTIPPSTPGSVTTAASEGALIRSGRVYQLPQILRYSQPRRKGFTSKFDEFAKSINAEDFWNQTVMEDARRKLMADRALYFSDYLCEVVVAIPDVGRVRAKVRDAFELTDPVSRNIPGVVISPGSNLKHWVVQIGRGVGSARTKMEARMIALIRDQLDPNFSV